MEETYSSDNERKFEGHVDAVTSFITSPSSTPAPRKSKTQAERQREYRLRLKQKQLSNAEEKKNNRKNKREYQRKYRLEKKMKEAQNMKRDKPAKKSRADIQREYRLRRKLKAELNSVSAEVIPRQEPGPSGYLEPVTKVQLTPLRPDAGPITIQHEAVIENVQSPTTKRIKKYEQIGDDHIEDEHIEDGQIEDEHIKDEHIEDDHIEDEHIEDEHIEDEHIEDEHIEDEHIEDGNIEDEHIKDVHIEDEHIECEHIEDEHIEDKHIEDEHIEDGHIEDEHIKDVHIEDEHIECEHIEDEHIKDVHIEDEHIECEHIEDEHIEDEHIEDEHIEDEHIEDEHIENEDNFSMDGESLSEDDSRHPYIGCRSHQSAHKLIKKKFVKNVGHVCNVRDRLWVDEGNLLKQISVDSLDEHTEDVMQPCECQPNVNTTEQSAVKLIQAVPLVKLVPKPEKQKTQEIEKGNVASDIDDKYDVLGKYVASKLRQLDVEQRMYVERIIHEAIYEGQMGHLNINSQLVVNTETFVPSQSHDRKRMRLEIAEIKVEKENDPETRETEPDIEERSEDETESGSSFIGCVVRRERLKAAEQISKHLIDVANIKLEVTTGENYHLRGNANTQYFNTNIQRSTVHESHCPDSAKRNEFHAEPYTETQTELEGFKLKTEIDTEENWNPHETHLDKGFQFRTDIDLSKIEHETNDELG